MTYKQAQTAGFVEKPYRLWTKDAEFVTKGFSNKWLDLFEVRGRDLVYKATLSQREALAVA